MTGSYGMVTTSGEPFDIEIPAFSLDSPQDVVQADDQLRRQLRRSRRPPSRPNNRSSCRTRRSPRSRRSRPCGRGRPARSSCSIASTPSREHEHSRAHVGAAEHAHAALVEQPIEQPLARQRRIDQFDVLDRLDQGAAFDPGIVFGDRCGAVPSGASPGSRSATRARSGACGRNCSRMPPARQRARAAGAGELLGDREPHPGRDLLGAQEILVRGIFEVPPSSATRP